MHRPDADPLPDTAPQERFALDFISKWSASQAAETANSQLFVADLCDLLGVELPRPQGHAEEDYVFERRVTNARTNTTNFVDLYRKGCFVWENKQGSDEASAKTTLAGERVKLKTGTARRGTPAWSQAMNKAKNQARRYAQALPPDHGWPPFLVVCDVGYCIDLYVDFTGQGKHYAPFPDSNTFRIQLDDLQDEVVRQRLVQLWTAPLTLDPAAESARVTRQLAEKLGTLAKRLEARGNAPEAVAQFLMRCLFSMFAEDVRLIKDSAGGKPFTALLRGFRQNLSHLPAALSDFWRLMDRGGFDRALGTQVKRFNGELFADATALDLDGEEADLLIVAAEADWSFVEPAIFGTLLERALDPKERHKLGAHFTPRAYVERLVLPTIIEPLREEWQAAQALAAGPLQREAELARKGADADAKPRRELREEAFDYVRDFHRRLCEIRVLDPACGSGNFLYVALEHMKRLEGEVLLEIEAYEGQQTLDMTGAYTVSPDQFRGIELNPRAAAIAEVVLWIGYLQWHFRTWGDADRLGEPILERYHNIECKDAVLESFMGQDRMPEWPAADFIIGNPPFIGTSRMRDALGDDYTERVRKLYSKTVPDSSDFVMYWWHRAAEVLRLSPKPSEHPLQRFGFITTNSIRQTFNRRVLQHYMEAKVNPISLVYAIPDHPWVDSADGADVRVSMITTGRSGAGKVHIIVRERISENENDVDFIEREGIIAPDLTVGVDTTAVVKLVANANLSDRGIQLYGTDMLIAADVAETYQRLGDRDIFPIYVNGRDLTQSSRELRLIDFYSLDKSIIRTIAPNGYNHLITKVKPSRDISKEPRVRQEWWLPGRQRPELRSAINSLNKYIVTVETSKHRFFQFLPATTLPDNMLIAVGSSSAFHLGALESRYHTIWALITGGRLGVGNDPRYNKTR